MEVQIVIQWHSIIHQKNSILNLCNKLQLFLAQFEYKPLGKESDVASIIPLYKFKCEMSLKECMKKTVHQCDNWEARNAIQPGNTKHCHLQAIHLYSWDLQQPQWDLPIHWLCQKKRAVSANLDNKGLKEQGTRQEPMRECSRSN